MAWVAAFPLTGPYTMADLAADAVGLLEIAGWDTCRVLGVSFGGMVAQEFAATNPQRVERLALACTSAGGDGGSSYPLQKLQELPAQERAAAQLKLADSRWDERWFEAHPADRALAEGLTAAGRTRRDPAAAAAYTAQLEARAGHDVWGRLDAITCPTLVGYGNYDQIARPRTAPPSHRASAELSCAATKEDTCSWSKTELHYRNSRHSSKRRRGAGVARDPAHSREPAATVSPLPQTTDLTHQICSFCAAEPVVTESLAAAQIGGSVRVLLDLPVTTRDLSPRNLHA